MLVNILKIATAILFLNIVMVYTEGCPYFRKVSERHRTCYEKSNCKKHNDCARSQMCCDNPCGVPKCYNITEKVQILTKCTVELESSSSCEKEKTTFCFKNDCGRCCHHDTICNPTPTALVDAERCFSEVCRGHTCKQQGEKCFVDKLTMEPYCSCNKICDGDRNIVCAQVGFNKYKSFSSECAMEREACKKKMTYGVLRKGMCDALERKATPYQKPKIMKYFHYKQIGDRVCISCHGDKRGSNLLWLQKRVDGSEVRIPAGYTKDGNGYRENDVTYVVETLCLPHLGYGSYGRYICRQEFKSTRAEAEVQIVPKNQEPFNRSWCNKPPDPGNCKEVFHNFYYDSTKGKCKPFVYRGCQGNENNFQTKFECEIRCAGSKVNSTFIHPNLIGESCGVEQCNFYSTCKNVKGSQECACNNRCPFRPDPVCGSDMTTYSSECIMKTIACRYAKPLFALYKGRCRKVDTQPTDKPIRSLCDLMKCPPYGKCFVNPFTKAPQCYCDDRCSLQAHIICASDHRHYTNECFMQVRSCQINRKLTVLTQGLCLFSARKKS